MQEQVVENEFNYGMIDETADISVQTRAVKVRKLNKKIGDSLKELYDYRCQICGERVGEEIGAHVVEAHHIDYFVKSKNNDMSNQIVLCPTHLRMIHAGDPEFDRMRRLFRYKNGYEQRLKLDEHLGD